MQRTTGAALVAALVIGGAAPGLANGIRGFGASDVLRARLAAASSSSGWAPTLTHAMAPSGAIDLGTVPAATRLKIVVGLTPNKAAAESALRGMYTPGTETYHQFMTPAQYLATFAPTAVQVNMVEGYLASKGFTGISASGNRLLVRADGTAAMASAAFNTNLHAFNQGGKAIRVNVTPAMVPKALSGVVSSVLGLQNVPMHIDLRTPSHNLPQRAAVAPNAAKQSFGGCTVPTGTGTCALSNFYTNDLETFYDVTNSPTAHNTNVAIFTEGDVSTTVSDLRINEKKNNLRQIPVTLVPVDIQSNDTFARVEWEMDTQTSTGIAGDVKGLYLYNVGSLGDEDLTYDFNRWVTDDVAPVASASLGECEYQAELDGAMPLDDFIFQEAALQGQTMFASSGDSGSSCGFNIVTNGLPGAGPPQVAYPATSPYVIGAGGTTLQPKIDGTYGNEISWNAGGGGLSLFEPPEFWTYGVVPTQCIPLYCSIGGPGVPVAVTGGLGRAVPDVAMDADANLSAANYVLNGAWTANGGTSLASPISMGVFARLESHFGNKAGFGAPALYASYERAGGSFTSVGAPPTGTIDRPIAGFHDVLVGDNGLYQAKPGYDLNTGMGSFDITRSMNYFRP